MLQLLTQFLLWLDQSSVHFWSFVAITGFLLLASALAAFFHPAGARRWNHPLLFVTLLAVGPAASPSTTDPDTATKLSPNSPPSSPATTASSPNPPPPAFTVASHSTRKFTVRVSTLTFPDFIRHVAAPQRLVARSSDAAARRRARFPLANSRRSPSCLRRAS